MNLIDLHWSMLKGDVRIVYREFVAGGSFFSRENIFASEIMCKHILSYPICFAYGNDFSHQSAFRFFMEFVLF